MPYRRVCTNSSALLTLRRYWRYILLQLIALCIFLLVLHAGGVQKFMARWVQQFQTAVGPARQEFDSKAGQQPKSNNTLNSKAGQQPKSNNTLNSKVGQQPKSNNTPNSASKPILHFKPFNILDFQEKKDYKDDFVYQRFKSKIFMDPDYFDFVINNKDICLKSKPKILIGVQNAPQHGTHRQTIRETWGSKTALRKYNATLVFFLGLPVHPISLTDIETENSKYGDIVVDGYLDTFKNLSLKYVSMLKWATHFCNDIVIFIHCDSDVFVNLKPILMSSRDIPGFWQNKRAASLGLKYHNSNVFRIKGHKYDVSESEYPFPKYPDYMDGCAFILNPKAVNALYVASKGSGYLWMPDVFLLGFLGQKVDLQYIPVADHMDLSRNTQNIPKNRLVNLWFVCHESTQDITNMWNKL